MKPYIILIIVFIIPGFHSWSQTPDVLLTEFNHKYPQEKIHVHFDKDAYVAGETMWFKAYLLSELLPDTISSSLFIELINQYGKVTAMKNLPVFEGTASGNFDLPDSLPFGYYKLRAYTAWMLNFDKSFLYTKNIFIYNDHVVSNILSPKNDNYKVDFFPEGGNMIADVVNFVAFKATDSEGYPLSFSGSIVDSRGNLVTSIKTIHDGMGKFTLLPPADEIYVARLKFDNGKVGSVQIPAARQGIAMHVGKDLKELKVTLSRAADDLTEKHILVLGQMENHVAFKTESVLTGESVSVAVPISNFPSGILQITIFDGEGKPLQERLTFINNGEYNIKSYFTTDTLNVNKRAKNVFTFSVPDSIEGSYSVAVTDENKTVSSAEQEHIISGFLLSSDIKGYVHNPAFYFSNNDKFTKDALDLVMMTNGWRRFKWQQLLLKESPDIKLVPLPFIRVSGKVYADNKKDLVKEGDLICLFKDKTDSSTIGFTVPIDGTGNFKIDSLIFSDSASLYFKYNTGKKIKQEVWVQLDQNSNWPLHNLPGVDKNEYLAVPDSFQSKLSKIKDQLKYYDQYVKNIIKLKEIKIIARKKTPEQLVNERYASSLFSSPGARTVDLINHPIPNGSKLSILIRSRFPRVDVVGMPGNLSLVRGITTSLMGGRQPITVFLDEVQNDINYIDNMPISEIALIKYVESFPMVDHNGPALFIYSKKIEDLAANEAGYIKKFTVPGYSFTKEFYSPDYSMPVTTKTDAPDIRTTLYWNPEILLDKNNQKETFRFYNSDDCHKMKVIIEGFNNGGKLCRIEKIIGM